MREQSDGINDKVGKITNLNFTTKLFIYYIVLILCHCNTSEHVTVEVI
jgi:hypothetical protein